ncbi:hypothetical protein ES703_25444 [subsurface metagenome]
MGYLKIKADTIYAAFWNWRTKMGEASGSLGMAAYYLGIRNWVASADCLQEAADDFYSMRSYMYSLGVAFHDSFDWMENNWAGLIEMEDIIDAMSAASPVEITYFVGIEDAFRQSIWNQPYEHEFFAALGRAFTRWP